MKKSFLFFSMVILLCTGCLNPGRIMLSIKKTNRPDKSVAYLAGALTVYATWRSGSLGLVFTNREKPSHSIVMFYSTYKPDFSVDMKAGLGRKTAREALVIVPIAPGTYQLTDIAYMPDQYAVTHIKPLDLPQASREITIQAGAVYYVGDWYGLILKDSTGGYTCRISASSTTSLRPVISSRPIIRPSLTGDSKII